MSQDITAGCQRRKAQNQACFAILTERWTPFVQWSFQDELFHTAALLSTSPAALYGSKRTLGFK